MNLIQNPTTASDAEKTVQQMQDVSSQALAALHEALIQTWKLLWEDEPNRLAKLAVMGSKAEDAFAQHARTWAFLEASGVPVDDKYKAPPADFVMPG